MPRGFPEIVDQHAEEAAFLWLLRNEATHAPNYDLDALAELDERIDAHFDGLRVAGAQGWDACRHQLLEWREPGEVFAAAHVALQTRIGRRVSQVLDVALESPELAHGFIGALGWFPFADVRPTIATLVESRDPAARRIGIAAAAAHRRDPGRALAAAVDDPSPGLRQRALEAAAELGRRDLLPHCVAQYDAGAEARFGADWAAALLGDGRAVSSLRATAVEGGSFAEAACDLATRHMHLADAAPWVRYLANDRASTRMAVTAARAAADPANVPWLIDLMATDEDARVAGEAFTWITGLDLTAAGLSAHPPDGFEGGPNDDPDDADVAMDPDEHLPWPARAAVAAWWIRHRARFAPGMRYLTGQPITDETLRVVLVRGTQRQRAAAALELVLRNPGQPLFEVRARADHQHRVLASCPDREVAR